MQPWVIKKIKEKAAESSQKAIRELQIPATEPPPTSPAKTKDGGTRGTVNVDFEL